MLQTSSILAFLRYSIILLFNNYPQIYYPPYDVNISVIGILFRLLDRLDKRPEREILIHNFCYKLSLAYRLHKKYPSQIDSFKDAVDIHMGVSTEIYETSAFWGVMLEWISLIDNKEIYTDIQTFLSDDLKEVTKCTWFLKSDEEKYLYENYAMNSSGDGVAIEVYEEYKDFLEQTTFIMSQYSEEVFSFDEYCFPALECILARYFNHFVRVMPEKKE